MTKHPYAPSSHEVWLWSFIKKDSIKLQIKIATEMFFKTSFCQNLKLHNNLYNKVKTKLNKQNKIDYTVMSSGLFLG
jgi:hypothetical protein